jgi:poly-beta-1,6-N-acetyl-D-glucosamine synthase
VTTQTLTMPTISTQPTVCVLIPAHNEERTISWCVEWVKNSSYPVNRVIVVADACSPDDKTVEIARTYGVEVFSTNHQDKAAAQNEFLFGITEDVIIGFDGDTAPDPDCIALMVNDLMKERIGITGDPYTWDATCSTILPAQGDVFPYTPESPIGKFQAAFFTGSRRYAYALGRRWWRQCQATVGRIQVLTGACYAFRTEAIQSIGGFPNGLITADMDATWALHGAGYKCGYTGAATSYTMDPEDFTTYRNQMRRWSSGYFQNMKKHRRQLTNWRSALVVGGAIADMVMLFLAEFVILWAAILGNHPAVIDAFAVWTGIHVVVCTVLVASVVGWRHAFLGVGPYLLVNYYNKWLYLCGMVREWILGRTYASWTGRQGRKTVITPMTARRRVALTQIGTVVGGMMTWAGMWQGLPTLIVFGGLSVVALVALMFPWKGNGRRKGENNR